MGISSSDVMDNENVRNRPSRRESGEDSGLASILQYIATRERIPSVRQYDDTTMKFVSFVLDGLPDTKMLDKSEVSLIIKQTAGLLNRAGIKNHKAITAMICARERGIHGSTSFSRANCCKINNNFLPDKGSVVLHLPTKIFCGVYLDNGNKFLSASQDKVIRIFDNTRKNYELIKSIPAVDVGWSILDVAVSPDGNYMAYSSWCKSLQLCRLRENSEVQDTLKLNFNENKFCVFSLKFSSDGKEILCGAYDGYIYVYDMESKRRAFKIIGHDSDVNAVAFADERSQILYSGGDDGVCKVWDRRTLSESNPKPVGCLAGHKHGITYIDPRGDGRHLLTNSKDQSIKLWDVRKFSSNFGVQHSLKSALGQDWDYRWEKIPPKCLDFYEPLEGDTSIMTYRGHSVLQTLCRCHFSPLETTGQRYIYTGCAAGRVIVYDVLTGKIEKELSGHRACVRDASWHPSRPEITSVSWDGNIIRWTYQEKHWLDSDDESSSDAIEIEQLNKNPERRRSRRIARRRGRLAERRNDDS